MTDKTNLVIPRSAIIVAERYRKDYGDLTGIIESLKRVGSIHPPVLSRNPDNTYTLIAGGRRMAAYDKIGVTEFHYGSVLEPGKYGFLFKEDVPEDELREAELDENLYRLKPKWHEDVLAVADIHAIKRRKHGPSKWGLRQTAELLGKGYGKSNVNYCVRLAECIKKNDKEILDCKDMSDAVSVLVKRKEDEALAEARRRIKERTGNMASVVIGTTAGAGVTSFLDVLKQPVGGIRIVAAPPPMEESTDLSEALAALEKQTPSAQSVSVIEPTQTVEPVTIPLSQMFFHGDFRDVVKQWPDACMDHVVTDIPYAIDMDNMDDKMIADVREEHDVEENLLLMEPFLRESFRIVKPGGFCVFFYDLDHHEKLQTWASAVGWRVQRWPLIAYKTSACRNQAAQYNFTKNYEVAMVLRRDEKTVLRKQQPSSVWMGDFAAERKLYNNPFAKPFALWKWIYEAISFPGQSIADLFVGEMSSSRAAVNCGLIPYGCEVKEQHFNRGIEHMKSVYALIHKSNVQFI